MNSIRTIVAVERKVAPKDRRTLCEEDAWTGRFSARLQTLNPLLAMLPRHQKALTAFEVAHDMEPEAAARIWADAPPPDVRSIAVHPHKGPRGPAATDPGIWLLHFVVKLRQLKPELSVDEAERAGIETLEFAGLVDPEEAVSVYSTAPPPQDVGAPGD